MPIDFLWGDEDFLIERHVNKLKQEILNEGINELNYLSVDNPPLSVFCELLKTNAMIFGEKVILIKCQKYFLDSRSNQKLDDKQNAQLIEAFNNVSDNIHIILVCPTPRGEKKKPDSRKKIYKELIKITKPIEFPSYKSYEENKLIPVVKSFAQELNLKIDNSSISFLIQTIGTSLRDINTQLEKLKLYTHPNNIVTKQTIEKVVSSNYDIFNLADLIIEKKWSQAINLLNEILQKEHYLPSLAFLQTTISNLVKIKLYSKDMSSFDIAMKLNQNEFIVRKNIQKVSKISLDDLINLKINLTAMEYNLKTGTIKDPVCGYEMAFFGGFGGRI